MADNTTLNSGSGGNIIRTLQDTDNVHWPVGVVSYATSVGTPDVLAIPVASALADAASNPTTLLSGACVLLYNGTTWDRIRGDTTNGVDVDVTRVIPGTSATHLGKAEDAAHGSGDTGVFVLAIRSDTAAQTAGTDGDYCGLICDSSGRLHVTNGYATGAGAVGATVQRVTLASDDPAVASLAILDDWDESDRAKVNLIVGQAGITAGAGAVGASTPRVTLASDDPAVASLGVLDDWDESDRAKVNLIVGQAGIAAGAGAVGVTVPRVTLASDDPAVAALQTIDNLVLAEDAAHQSGDSGVQVLAVRKDSGAAVAGTDGDYSPLQVDANGNLRVNIAAGAAAGGTSATDDADFTAASTAGTPVMGVYQTVVDNVTDGDMGVARLTQKRAIHVALYDSSGNEVSVGGGTQYDEDTAHAGAEKLTMAGVVRQDTPASLVGADADRTSLIVSSTGRLWASATIDAALPAGTNAIGKLAANSGVDIGDVDVTSVIPGTGATNLGKAIDAVAGASDTGVAALAIRDDSLSALTPAEGDWTPLRVDANGALHVTGGGGGTQYAVDSAAGGTDTGTLLLAIRDDALSTLTPADGDYVGLRVTSTGALHVNPGFAVDAGAVGATVLRTTLASDDPAVVALQIIDDWDESDRAKVNLIAGQAGITGGAGAVGASTPRVTLASDDPAVVALQVMDDWDNAASDGVSVSGEVAHDAADAGEPVKIGAKATTSVSGLTLVAANDRTNLFAGVDGVLITRPHSNLEDIVTATPVAITDGSSTQVLAAQGAGIKIYVVEVIIANSSSTDVTVDLRDGTGGSVKATFPVPANGGVVKTLSVPLPFSANTAVAADPSAAASTITVTLIGFKSKV